MTTAASRSGAPIESVLWPFDDLYATILQIITVRDRALGRVDLDLSRVGPLFQKECLAAGRTTQGVL